MNWARPFAITGQFGYAIPGTRSATTASFDPDTGDQIIDTEFHPRVFNWGGSLQYSMPYLKSAVVDLGLPDFFNHLIPIVEASLQTPVSNTFSSGTVTTGTISPGVIWTGRYYQVGIEALIPINRPKRDQCGRHRAVASLPRRHLPLDYRPAFVWQHYHRFREADVRQLTMRHYFIVVVALSIFSLQATPALAHAMLDHANPRVGSSQPTGPREVTLWFTQSLEPAFSTIEVRSESGAVMSSGKAQVDRADRTQLRVSLKPLPPGTYKVIWRVLSVDTHRTQGDFSFRVGQ